MNDNEERNEIQICKFELVVESDVSPRDGRLLMRVVEHRKELDIAFRREVTRKFPQHCRLNSLQFKEGSVIICATLVGAAAFFTNYKDIKESLELLLHDLEDVFKVISRNYYNYPCHVESRTLQLSDYSKIVLNSNPSDKKKTGTIVLAIVLAALAMASAIVFSANRDSKPNEGVVWVTPTNDVASAANTIVISCAHCIGKGTCHAESNDRSCVRCRMDASANDPNAVAICTVCQGRGYTLPGSKSLTSYHWMAFIPQSPVFWGGLFFLGYFIGAMRRNLWLAQYFLSHR